MVIRLWVDEQPDGRLAQRAWCVRMLMSALVAAMGAHVDHATRRHPLRRDGWGVARQLRPAAASALRRLRKAPAYAVSSIAILSVTIALATTTLAVVDGVLFKPLPYPHAHQLLQVMPGFADGASDRPGRINAASPVDVAAWQAALPNMPMTAYRAQPWAGLGAGVNDATAGVASVDPRFFEVIGVRPLIGGFVAGDYLESQSVKPVITTYDVWKHRYGLSADVIGRVILTDHAAHVGVRIVGVMPKEFEFPTVSTTVLFLTPLVDPPARLRDPNFRALTGVIMRAPSDVSVTEITDKLKPALARVATSFPPRGPKPEGWSESAWKRQGPFDHLTVMRLSAAMELRSGPLFRAVLAAIALLLVLASVNVSGLMAARALDRQHELRVRRSLGAGRMSLAVLWISESAILFGAGTALGLAASPLLLDTVARLIPGSVVLLKPVGIDWRVAAIVAGTVVTLTMMVAIWPWVRSLRESMAHSPLSHRGAPPPTGLGRRLVLPIQIAFGVVLTVVGTAFVGSLLNVYGIERPVRTRDIAALRIMFQGEGATMDVSSTRATRERTIRERLQQLPGVAVAASTAAQVLAGGGALSWFQPPEGVQRPPNLDTWAVTEGFYDALTPELVEGRLPTNAELRSAAPVIVVSESVSRAFWPNSRALGQPLVDGGSQQPFTVVGIVKDVPWLGWETTSPAIYAPYASVGRAPWITLFLRTDGPMGRVIDDAVRTVEKADPLTRVMTADALDGMFRDSVSLRRLQSWVYGCLAAVALLIVGSGTLGILGMTLAQRTHEAGVRLALGASPGRVTRDFLREHAWGSSVGLAVGIIAGYWAAGAVEASWYGLTAQSPGMWAVAVVLVMCIITVGGFLPARRISRTDPLVALRVD